MSFAERLKSLLKNGLFWMLILFGGVIVLFNAGVSFVSNNVSDQQLELIEAAVRRSAVQCYAVEGSYPSDLEYLVEDYGLFYDSENYVIHYNSLGSNLLPQIRVFFIGNEA